MDWDFAWSVTLDYAFKVIWHNICIADHSIIIVVQIWIKSTAWYKKICGALDLLWLLSRAVQIIQVFCWIAHYISNAWWKFEENRWNGSRDIRCLLFSRNSFSTWRQKTKLYGNFEHLSSDNAQILWNFNTPVIIRNRYLFSTLPEKGGQLKIILGSEHKSHVIG